jgi:hypothetical protein
MESESVPMDSQRALVVVAAVVIGVLGALAIAAGIIYFTVESKSLPSFMGQIKGDTAHRSLRGVVSLIVGVLLVAAAIAVFFYRPHQAD